MKHIFISLIVLLAIGGAYIGYEVMSVQRAFSPTNPELVGPGTENALDNISPSSTEPINSMRLSRKKLETSVMMVRRTT
jgi:uncharacterized membrane protein